MRHASVLALPAVLLVACGGAVNEPIPEKGRQSSTAESADEGSAASATNGASANETDDECVAGQRRSCDSTNTAFEDCTRDENGRRVWGECAAANTGGSSTPLVLVFDGAPVTFAAAPAATFDLAGDGASHVTGWPTARTPWLALDRDGNGRIDDGSELFGSMTRLATGRRAKNGFEALAELDSNHDGAITADDADFAMLRLWSDHDADRRSSAAEQTSASERIVRIELAYRTDRRCTTSGDCEVERATFSYRAADGSVRTGEVVDVHLRHH